jgi:hypothetical protein
MPERNKIVVAENSVDIFRGARDWRRDLEIIVRPESPSAARRILFPAESEYLNVDGLVPRSCYEIRIRRRNVWHRWRHRASVACVETRTRAPRVLITGSGRSGTRTLAGYLDGGRFRDGQAVIARHEPLAEFALKAWLAGDRDLIQRIQEGAGHNVESASYYALFPDLIRAERVIHVVRDGRRVVQSGLNRGWYQLDTIWNRIKPEFPGDVFARCCQFWRHTNEAVAAIAQYRFRLEDLLADPATLAAFRAATEIEPSRRTLPHLNRGSQSSSYGGWSDAQRDVFTAICGPLMDCHYPGWRGTW